MPLAGNTPQGYGAPNARTRRGPRITNSRAATVATTFDPPNLAVAMAGTSATLTWDASPTAGITGYDVYRRVAAGNAAPLIPGIDTPIATNVTSPYVDSGLSVGQYEWEVFGNSWSPLSLPGLLAWYDPSVASSVTASGALASQWNDLSGNGYHVTQATGGAQPDYSGSYLINGLAAMNLHGGQYMTNSSLDMNITNTFLAAVASINTVADRRAIIGNTSGNAQWVAEGSMRLFDYSGFGLIGLSSTNVDLTAAHLYESSRVNGGAIEFYLDGAGDGSTSSGFTSSGSAGISIGSLDIGSAGNALLAKLGEIIVCSSIPNTTDRQLLEAYIKAKWGTP